MPYEMIHVEEDEGVLIVTLDDPQTRNSLGPQMNKELTQELDRFENSASLRVFVLTGKDPAFCSGANVRGFARRIDESEQGTEEAGPPPPTPPWELMDPLRPYRERGPNQIIMRFHHLQKPSIAAVNGYAMGIGCGLALSCDMRIASDKAGFCEAFIRNGLIPADGSAWQLPRLIGLGRTLELQYTGDIVDGAEAYRIGMANRVVPHDQLMGDTLEFAKRLASGPTYSMGLIKHLVQESLHMDLKESLILAGRAQDIARGTDDHKEGVRAFLEKRKPAFKGR